MADEMLGAVDHEVPARLHRRGLHAAKIRSGAGLRHRQAFGALAADRGQEVSLALFTAAREKDVRGTADAGPVQGVVGPAELLLVEHPGDRIQARAAHVRGHVGGIKTRVDGLGLELAIEVLAQLAGLLHFLLVGIELVDHEIARGFHDHLLFVV